MDKKYVIAIVAVAAIASVIGVSSYVSAYQGNPDVKGPNYTPERHEAMQKAFSDKDYQAWKGLMAGRGRASQVVNEGNFARFSEMHQLMLDGKIDEANKIRTELGLGAGGRGQGRAGGCPMMAGYNR